jgi:hypothetical protein
MLAEHLVEVFTVIETAVVGNSLSNFSAKVQKIHELCTSGRQNCQKNAIF